MALASGVRPIIKNLCRYTYRFRWRWVGIEVFEASQKCVPRVTHCAGIFLNIFITEFL